MNYANKNAKQINDQVYDDEENRPMNVENEDDIDRRSLDEYEQNQTVRTNRKQRMVQIGKAYFSLKFFIASILIYISGLLHLAAFAGPYWSQSYPSTGNEFKNIGLWDVCFYRYRHWKDDNQKPYTGCFWFWSPDMIRFRDWIMPPWFIAVQFFACFALIFVFVVLAFIAVSCLTNIRFKFYFVFPITILTFFAQINMFLCLLIYGINGDNREWMPRPEFNVYSWSYWFVLSACFFLLNATILLLFESKTLYAVYQKERAIKKQYEMMAIPINSNLNLNINASLTNSVNYA